MSENNGLIQAFQEMLEQSQLKTEERIKGIVQTAVQESEQRVLVTIDEVRTELLVKIDAVDTKVDAVHAELLARIDAVDAKVDAVRAELLENHVRLNAKLDRHHAEHKADNRMSFEAAKDVGRRVKKVQNNLKAVKQTVEEMDITLKDIKRRTLLAQSDAANALSRQVDTDTELEALLARLESYEARFAKPGPPPVSD
ncbi:MAG: hypothetical protein K1Y36_04965 [Blastocatellia bacterium]|nr:hypothetical protein [Blastocatellia bacterium]